MTFAHYPEHAIHLYRDGDHVVVAIEHGGKWIPIIRERHDSPFSHICEPGGMQTIIDGKRKGPWP